MCPVTHEDCRAIINTAAMVVMARARYLDANHPSSGWFLNSKFTLLVATSRQAIPVSSAI